MRHVVLFLALGVCSAQTVPLTRETTDPEGDVRRPDFTVDAGGPVISLVYSADGNTLTSEDAKHIVALWDVKNGRPVRKTGAGQTPPPGAVTAFSADSAQAASVVGVAIKVWENRTGRLLTTLLGHTAAIRTLVFSPNGRTIASAGDDGAIRLWTMPLPPLSAEDLLKIEAAIPSQPTARPRGGAGCWCSGARTRSNTRRACRPQTK